MEANRVCSGCPKRDFTSERLDGLTQRPGRAEMTSAQFRSLIPGYRAVVVQDHYIPEGPNPKPRNSLHCGT